MYVKKRCKRNLYLKKDISIKKIFERHSYFQKMFKYRKINKHLYFKKIFMYEKKE